MCASGQKCNHQQQDKLIEAGLLRFISLLRRSGLRISSAESLDALQSLTHVDIKDRREAKAALRGTLVKDAEHAALFDQAFDAYFLPPEQQSRVSRQHQEHMKAREEQLDKAMEDLQFQGEQLELSEEEGLAYNQMSAEEQQRLREFLKQSSEGKNVDKKFKPMVESLVKGHMTRWQKQTGFKAFPVDSTGDDYMDALMMELALNAPQDTGLLYRDMGEIEKSEIPRMNQVIHRLSRKLATRISRRYEQSKKVKQVDIRKTIRANMRYGGIPLDLKYRQRSIKKPDILLLCDVSGSMNRYSTFTMLFTAGLSTVIRKLQLFLFAEDLERVNLLRRSGNTLEEFAYRMQEESRVWGEGTDLNRALGRLMSSEIKSLSSNTVVIIISDTKTMRFEAAAAKLERISRRVKDVIWLNPLPEDQWSRHATVREFQKHSRMFLCNNLYQLEKVFREKLF